MSYTDDQRLTAHHEAGHAVAAWALAIWFRGVWVAGINGVDPTERGMPASTHGMVESNGVANDLIMASMSGGSGANALMKHAVLSLAGPAAELWRHFVDDPDPIEPLDEQALEVELVYRYAPREPAPDEGTDEWCLHFYADQLEALGIDRDRAIGAACCAAADLVRSHWTAIESLAARLLVAGELDTSAAIEAMGHGDHGYRALIQREVQWSSPHVVSLLTGNEPATDQQRTVNTP